MHHDHPTESDVPSSSSASGRSARSLALDHLRRLAKRFPDLPLEEPDTAGLDARDAALARAIVHAVIRQWITLETVVRSRIERPWERVQPEARAALMVGAAQMFLMDRIPDHAAVDGAVGWIKRRVNQRAAGFVNAVLRRLIDLRGELITIPAELNLARTDLPRGDGTMWRLREEVFAQPEAARLAEQTSHPESLIAAWTSMFGVDEARRIALHDLLQPPVILADVPRDVRNPLLGPHEQPGFAVFTGSMHELGSLLAEHPGMRVQDPASAAAIEIARGPAVRRIADLCAGRGTKTAQLAATFPDAEIVAADPDRARAEVLRAAFADHPRVRIIDPERWIDEPPDFDLIVLDVPCSNTGVLARRIEAKHRWSAERVDGLVGLQRAVIAEGLRLRAPAGRLLYTTCSLEKMENERQAEWIAHWHPLRVEAQRRTMPRGLPGDPPAVYHDGGFAALLSPA